MIPKTEKRNGDQKKREVKKEQKRARKKLQEMVMDFIHVAHEEAVEKDRFNPIFRKCGEMSDEDFFFYCTVRAMGQFESGRAFLQSVFLKYNWRLPRTRFFQALQSKRRMAVVRKTASEVFRMLERQSTMAGINFLSAFPELEAYAVFNGDGHFIEHAAHIVPTEKKTFAAGSIYVQSLRTGNLLPLCSITDGDSKPHEMPVFRKAVEDIPASWVSGYAKTLWVLDMAYVDNRWWGFQRQKGHYYISRLKSNASPIKCGDLPYDKDDPINKGVTASYQAGMSCGWLFRVVEYTDPETGEAYSFVTNLDRQIRPGLIAWLYFKRWNIEKNFDTTKNTMKEKKAWARGKGALTIQSHAIAFAYNIMRLFHEMIACEQREEAENAETLSERKYRKALKRRQEKAAGVGREIHPMLLTKRMARIPSAFVRCFRLCFFDNMAIGKTWGLLTNTLYRQL